MIATLSSICRHPVKSLGEEVLDTVTLTSGRHMPFDRTWAVCHGGSEFDPENPVWVKPRNFVNQAFVPTLARIRTSYDEERRLLTLEHPDADQIKIDPDHDGDAICDWLLPLAQDRRAGPYRLARLPEGGLTDFKDTHLAINSTRSLAVLEDACQTTLHHGRFRGNLWLDGLDPWQEFEWIDREITIGNVQLRITDRIARCNATTANPETGMRDVPVLEILQERWDHMDFGIYAQVVSGGRLRTGDPVLLH
ncbi:MAG: MOSC N-terminal beta barrel domain-containing protein [Pseudomonadota bacterium]